jgi:hypothetical protein
VAAKKKEKCRPLHVWPLYTITINERKLRALVTDYASPKGSYHLQGYRIFDGSKLVEEEPGRHVFIGQGSGSYHYAFKRLAELASEAARNIDQRAHEQVCTARHEMFGNRSVRSSVFKLENGNVGWALATKICWGDDDQPANIVCGPETCGDSPEGWTRLARLAAQEWREKVRQEIMKPW